MKSFTKSDFSDEVIAELVRGQFGTAVFPTIITPLKDGWFNTAYALSLSDGQPDVVLRIAPPPGQPVLSYERDLMQREAAIMRLVEEKLDIPVAPLLAYDGRRQLLDRDYMFVGRLAGRPLDQAKADMPPEELTRVLHQLGEYAARMHALHGARFGYDCPDLSAETWRAAFLRMMAALLADGEGLGVLLPVPYTAVRQRLDELASLLDAVQAASLVHWDLWEGNIFVAEVDGRFTITGIIDWERALWGDPDIDQVMFRREKDPFWVGYGRLPAADPAAQTRRTLYRLYLWLIMLIEDKVRFDGADHIPWAIEQFNRDWQQLTAMSAPDG
ncbi:MAG: aminoglycoside phosphotransferase family protein [Chloroflexi bacterium]|nr:aminoglycoside phosphotransferase family protein [Chloroflexota bacterium]